MAAAFHTEWTYTLWACKSSMDQLGPPRLSRFLYKAWFKASGPLVYITIRRLQEASLTYPIPNCTSSKI